MMKGIYKIFIVLAAILVSCTSVNKRSSHKVNKLGLSDYFKNTIVESEFFKISAIHDSVITSDKGIYLVVPKNAFVDKTGRSINDSIDIEFAAATSLPELILSNLVYSDSTQDYYSKQAFYLNATFNGQQLMINPKNPVYIELSSEDNLYLHKGNRDKYGNMNWDTAINHVNYLINIAFEDLDFLPPNFALEVESGLPFKNHYLTSKDLLDSLYYSFAAELDEKENYFWLNRFNAINILGYINYFVQEELIASDSACVEEAKPCGINPASISAIQSKKFEKTFIATREFEARLKIIYKSCNTEILELYINNLGKDLWEIDQMAAELLGESNALQSEFVKFASYKHTNVRISDEKAELLAQYYQKQKTAIEKKLNKVKQKLLESKKKLEEYKNLLSERQAYRNKKFGFELTELGWYNATTRKHVKELKTFILNVKVPNGNSYERVYTYAVNENINSIYSMISSDNIHFDKVYKEDPFMLINEKHNFKIIGIGFSSEQTGFGAKQFSVDSIVNADVELSKMDIKELKKQLKQYSFSYRKENKILVDLEYQAFFYKEKKRREKELQEALFINSLRKIVFPCCPINDKYIEFLHSGGGS